MFGAYWGVYVCVVPPPSIRLSFTALFTLAICARVVVCWFGVGVCVVHVSMRLWGVAIFGIGEDSGQVSPVLVWVPSLLLVVGVEVCLGFGSGFHVSLMGRCVEVVVAQDVGVFVAFQSCVLADSSGPSGSEGALYGLGFCVFFWDHAGAP